MHKLLPSVIILLTACQEEEQKPDASSQNHNPGIIDISVTPDEAVKTIDTLNCDFEANDIDGDPLTIEVNWFNTETGELLGQEAYLQLDAEAVDPGDKVRCEVTATDPAGATGTAAAEVTVENSEPKVEAVEITPEEGINNDTELNCSASTSDLDQEEIEVEYKWEHNGEVIGEGDKIKLANHQFEPGETISCIADVQDPHGANDSAKADIVIGNRAPYFTDMQIEFEGSPTTRSLLSCQATAADDDGDSTSMTYRWLSANDQVIGEESSIQLNPSMVTVGDVITCEVTVIDSSGAEHLESTQVTLENIVPNWSNEATITPDQDVEVNNELNCQASAIDGDDEEVSITYEWKNSMESIGSGPTLQLDQNNSIVDDQITCVATATDPHGAVISSEAMVTVENSVPEFSLHPRIYPKADIFNDSLLSCEAVAGDANGDTVELQYEWQNTTQQKMIGSSESLQLNDSLAMPGDEIKCLVTAIDSHGGENSSSSSVSIQNNKPSFTTMPSISPNVEVKSNTTIACKAEAADDGGTPEITFVWRNETQETELGKDSTLTLNHELAQPNDEISCTAIATDNQNLSESSSISVVVENSAPTFDTAAAISSDTVIQFDSKLTCSATASDIDGDSPSLGYKWTNETQGTELGKGADLTLSADLINANDTVSCSVTATDLQGKESTSVASVEVANSEPYFTQNPAITPATDAKIGVTLTCSAEAEDLDGSGLSLSYTWKNASTDTVIGSGASLVLAEGMAQAGEQIQCTVDATDNDGGSVSEQASIQLDNTAPHFSTAAEISPASTIFNTSTLSCNAEAADVDGDAPSISYEWTNETQGTILGSTDSITLDSSSAQPNDTIGCKVTATDVSLSSTTSSSSIVVESAAPTFDTQASISPNTGVKTNSALSCSAAAVDHAGQAVTLEYKWQNQNGNIELGSGDSLTLSNTLAQPNDSIVCIVTAAASNGEVTVSQSTVVVENSTPTGLLASLSPQDPVEGADEITCEVDTEASDLDGQELNYSFEWSINDQPYDGATSDDQYTGDVLPVTAYQANDEIKCEIVVTDGEAELRSEDSVSAEAPVDPLSVLSDEFDDASSMTQWNRLFDTEQWANGDQLEQLSMDDGDAGKLSMIPYASGWDGDFRGAMMYKEVTGNFVITTQLEVSDRAESGAPGVIGSLGGIIIRTPKATSAADWTAGMENHLMFSVGSADTVSSFQLEAKNTINSVSDATVAAAAGSIELRAARIDNTIIVLYRLASGNWELYDRFSRADMPAALQVGLTATTDWDSISAMDALSYNNSVVSTANPDFMANFDYVRYLTPELADPYLGIDLSDDTLVTDAELLSLFGSVLDN